MSRRNPRRDAEVARKQSLADRQQREWEQAAATAVIKYLGAISEENKTRQIRSMGQHEVEGVAIVAIGAYVQVRRRQEDDEKLQRLLEDDFNDPIDDMFLG